MKIYISGKMRGLSEEDSRKLFKAAEQYLKTLGHDVINPWDSEDEKKRQCKVWADFILYDLQILKTCDAIFMLDNWQDSNGAKCEHAFASGRHMKIIYDAPYKEISELPVEVKNKIYELRFPCDKDIAIDEYISHYCLIVVDDVAYAGDDKFSHKLLKLWLLADDKIRKASLAHAIIVNNHVIKNRFGGLSSN